MEKNLKIIIGIFLLLSALKVIYTFFVTSPTIFADEYFYSKMAQSYFYFREFSLHSELVKAYPPLYSVLISPAFIFKNMTYVYTAIKIINSVISSLIIFPVYYFAKEILTEKKALLAAILISVAPMSLAFSGYIMSENLFYVLFLTAAYFIYKASKENNLIYDAFAGIFIGLTILTRYLGLALLVPVGIIFLYDLFVTKNKTNKLVTISIALAIFGAWLFRNGYLFGYDLSGIFGTYIREGYPVTFTPLSLTIWTILNFATIIISTGFIFVTAIFSDIKENFRKHPYFYFILFSVLITTLVMMAERTAGSALFKVDTLISLTGRPSARYTDVLTPLIIIGGLVSMKSKLVSNKLIVVMSVLMVLASQLVFFDLFPANNMSLFWLGVVSYFAETAISNIYILTAIYAAILLAVFIAAVILLKYLNTNKLVALMIVFFLALSLVNMFAISQNSNEWSELDDGQLGLWINDNLHGTILIDDSYCNEFDFRDANTLCSKKNKSSLLGFWINEELRVGSKDDETVDYIITRTKLDLKKVYALKGTFVYQVQAV